MPIPTAIIRASQELFALNLLGWDPAKLRNFDGSRIARSHDPGDPVVGESCCGLSAG